MLLGSSVSAVTEVNIIAFVVCVYNIVMLNRSTIFMLFLMSSLWQQEARHRLPTLLFGKPQPL